MVGVSKQVTFPEELYKRLQARMTEQGYGKRQVAEYVRDLVKEDVRNE
jgi:metal-responsive CopG/Arc/MetJ family transcriptional regulator